MNKKVINSSVLFLVIIFYLSGLRFLSAQEKTTGIQLSLEQAVELALKNNRAIKEYNLGYKFDKTSLNYAQRQYEPVISIGPAANFEHDYTKNGGQFSRINSLMYGVGAKASMLLPTGATISYDWEGGYFSESNNYSTFGKTSDDFWKQGGILSFNQPLLKGAWYNVTNSTIDLALYSDSISYQSLRSEVTSTIASAIYAYRNLISAIKVVDIAKNSVKLSNELLDMNKALVTTGIIAQTDLIQNEGQVTNAEFRLLSAENNLNTALLALNELLELGPNAIITPASFEPDYNIKIDSAAFLKTALSHNTVYLTALYNLKKAEINLMLAEDNKEINLNIYSQYRNTTNSVSPYTLNNNLEFGLNLSYTLTDRSRDELYEQGAINVDRAKNNLRMVRNRLEIELSEKLSNLRLAKKAVEMAKKIKDFAKEKLEVEKKKMKIGKSATFTLVTFHNDLVEAENNEISSMISYLNAITALHYFVGDLLEQYNITL